MIAAVVLAACGTADGEVTGDTGVTRPMPSPSTENAPDLQVPAASPAVTSASTPTGPAPVNAAPTSSLASTTEFEAYEFVAASGLRIPVPQLDGFVSPDGVRVRTGIPGLETQGVSFERIAGEDGRYENYSVALLAGPEVKEALRDTDSTGYRPVDGLSVGGQQVYSRQANLDSPFPSYEFAWAISDSEVVALLTEYIGEERLLEVVYAMGATK